MNFSIKILLIFNLNLFKKMNSIVIKKKENMLLKKKRKITNKNTLVILLETISEECFNKELISVLLISRSVNNDLKNKGIVEILNPSKIIEISDKNIIKHSNDVSFNSIIL